MNLDFWHAVRARGYRLPEHADLGALTDELLAMLGSPDGDLRDDIAYATLATWLRERRYTTQALHTMGGQMVNNLRIGLGEEESDSVFLRAFSVLILGEIVALDAQDPQLHAALVREWAAEASRYLRLERDERGYVPGHGWAHAAAHTADCLSAIAAHPATDAADLREILTSVADRILRPAAQVFLHDEDERLAFACLAVLRRAEIAREDVLTWCARFDHPEEDGNWQTASSRDEGARTYVNVKAFLRSLYFQLLWTKNQPPHRDDVLKSVLETIRGVGWTFACLE